MSEGRLEQFRRTVLDRPALQARLRATSSRQSFIALMVELGEEHGFDFAAAEVEDALSVARREWFEKWV